MSTHTMMCCCADASSNKRYLRPLLSQLARTQQRAITWCSVGPQEECLGTDEGLPFIVETLSFSAKVASFQYCASVPRLPVPAGCICCTVLHASTRLLAGWQSSRCCAWRASCCNLTAASCSCKRQTMKSHLPPSANSHSGSVFCAVGPAAGRQHVFAGHSRNREWHHHALHIYILYRCTCSCVIVPYLPMSAP
jgi:hypothetical protein